ncbi:MAG: hypothetical protein IPK37_06220 [Austwickia sp.]|jgi:S-formylglutathione hydrolase FrmB|nr:MAG: hypothetical protein IPK37_06220 [Austwickia sp.]
MSLGLPDRTTPGDHPDGSIYPSPGAEPTRRAVLGAGLAGVASLVVAGLAGGAIHSPTLIRESGTLTTAHWPGRRVGWMLARPASPRGVIVALHGMGGKAEDWFGSRHLDRAVRGTGLAVAAIDGAASYWHPRATGPYAGSDTASMVIEDFLPLLARRGLPTERIGLLGASMGGYGSLYVGAKLGAERVFGIATLAAALRTSGAGTYPERFDSPADYAAHDVFARAGELGQIPLFLACGKKDRFRAGNEAFARVVPAATTLFDEGDHVGSWFDAHVGPAVQFLAEHAPA